MPAIEYAPQHFEQLRAFVARLGIPLSLTHRPFVDYYYASGQSCRLYLFVANDGKIVATYGLDRMRFEHAGRIMTIGAGSNYYSAEPGAGGLLFMHWLKACPIGLVHGGSADTHRIIRGRNWAYYDGIRDFILNNPYDPNPGEPRWRVVAKHILRHAIRSELPKYASRIPAEIRTRVSVREEKSYTEDLLPRESPFTFRLAPTLDYLNWRYNTALSFMRYRLFRVLEGGRTKGYVVLNESSKQIIVAHCDGSDARTVAYGVLLSLLQAGREDRAPRTVLLSSSHVVMQDIYRSFGFRSTRSSRPFAIGTLTGPCEVQLDTSNWLVNFDWGDNGLRFPFLDQPKGLADAEE